MIRYLSPATGEKRLPQPDFVPLQSDDVSWRAPVQNIDLAFFQGQTAPLDLVQDLPGMPVLWSERRQNNILLALFLNFSRESLLAHRGTGYIIPANYVVL
jgi:hypothetical protein